MIERTPPMLPMLPREELLRLARLCEEGWREARVERLRERRQREQCAEELQRRRFYAASANGRG